MSKTVKIGALEVGRGDPELRLGMSMGEVLGALGAPSSVYPEPEDYDPEIDGDRRYFRYGRRDVEFDRTNRVVTIHYRASAAIDLAERTITREFLETLLGKPSRSGVHKIRKAHRTWVFFGPVGLQAEFDAKGRLVSLSIGEPDPAPARAKRRAPRAPAAAARRRARRA